MEQRPFVPLWICAALAAGLAVSDACGGDDSAARPAQVTQVWPQHVNGAALPATDTRDTDPNCPKGGRMWRWVVVPPRTAAREHQPRVCAIEVLPRAKGGDAWVDDADAHPAGEVGMSLQTRDGRDFWSSDASRGAWWTDGCERPLPTGGFTFTVTLTRKEAAKAELRPVRFRFTGGEVNGPPTATTAPLGTVETWTDPFGTARSVPLTVPVTRVLLSPQLVPSRVAAASSGLRGLVVVRGAQAGVKVRHVAAAGKSLTVYSSVERDLEDDDPSPSGLRAVRAPITAERHISVTTAASALDGTGTGAFTVSVPEEKALAGFSFYVQAGIGKDAVDGLSCPLCVTVVDSLTDYDGDGRPNASDVAPLDQDR